MMLFEVVTPERLLLSEEVEEVIIPGEFGQLGILPGHHPLLASLGIGELIYRKDGVAYSLFVAGGFVEVLTDRVTVLAGEAQLPSEIDIEGAERQKEEAERELKALIPLDPGYEEVLAKLKKASVKLELGQRSKGS